MNFAIIGCGRVAEVHAAAIMETEGAILYATCDISEHRLEPFHSKFKANHLYTDYQLMLENPNIDVVNICTPNGMHAEMAIRAIEKGKHVMIEKPMAITDEDAVRIIEAAQRHQVKATVVHQNRFNDAILMTKEALEGGKFGKLAYGTASVRWNRNQDYYDQDAWRGTEEMQDGVLMNQAIHTIDLLIWLMGPVKSVTGKTVTRIRDIEMEDVGTALLEFESGAIGGVDGTSTTFAIDLGASINLFGELGTVCIGGNAANRIDKWRFTQDFKAEEESVLGVQKELPESVYGDGHKLIIRDFVSAVKENREPFVSLEAGRDAVRVILSIYQSSKTGKSVVF
ncbi:Gfo/Idh/MocA family protein [Litchfieldia salsa]|uniref:Predicted dehydrogenase n=1 Tax=Litchfieldia salsa TaxID=930152 RepID=A0A1H0W0S9_9BACI|nr:Gfo/Idh/MocA family oxidoreductase [Litchfieldia salsa]SDP84158.1 Predicted dehydrogenase [Litchfieldia salsa]